MPSKKTIYCSLDIESTGLDAARDHIIEVGAVLFEIEKNGEIKFGKEFSELVKPPIEIPVFIQNLTGIKQVDVESARTWEEIMPAFKKFVGKHAIVGQNVFFDLKFIESRGLAFKNKVIDTQVLARVFAPDSKQFNLDYLHTHFGLKIESHHRALADSKSAATILGKIISSFYTLPQASQKEIGKLLAGSSLAFKDLFRKSEKITVSAQNKAKPAERRVEIAKKQKNTTKQVSLFEEIEKPGPKKEINQNVPAEWKIDKLIESKHIEYLSVPINFMNSETVGWLSKKLSLSKSKIVLAVSSAEELGSVRQSGDWLELKEPGDYLCGRSFNNWLLEKDLPDDLIQFLIKVLIWQVRGGKSFSELSTTAVEYLYRSLISGNVQDCERHINDNMCGFGKVLSSFESSDKFLVQHSALPYYASIFKKRSVGKVFIWNMDTMLSSLENSQTTIVTLKKVRGILQLLADVENKKGLLLANKKLYDKVVNLLNKIDLDFGLLGIELSAEPFVTGQRLVDEDVRENYSFSKIESVFKKLTDNLKEVFSEMENSIVPDLPIEKTIFQLTKFTNFFHEFFNEPKFGMLYWFDTFGNEIKLGIRPKLLQLSELFPKVNFIFLAPFSSSEANYYLQSALGLEVKDIGSSLDSATGAQLAIPEENFKPLSDTRLMQLLDRLSGRTLVLFNSQKALDAAYAQIEKGNTPNGLLAQRHTGHHWKNAESFANQPRSVWLLTVHNYLKYVHKLPNTETLILAKIPYAVSDAAAASIDPEDVFPKFVLPKTTLRLEQILSRFVNSSDNKKMQTVTILDTRITADYNSAIYESLNHMLSGEVKHFSSIDSLEDLLK